MATVTFASGARVSEVRPDPAFDAGAALREPETLAAPLALLHGVNATESQTTSVRTGWSDAGIFFVFDCADRHVVAPGRQDGMDHFKLGDTVEVFIGRRGEPGYAEIHATPAGKKALYFFDGYRRRIPAPSGAEHIGVMSAVNDAGWRAVITVPWGVLGGKAADGVWDVFFGRYDYAKEGAVPVLSSYPEQRGDKPDFHRRADYAAVRFVP
jgi:hypothetical protein